MVHINVDETVLFSVKMDFLFTVFSMPTNDQICFHNSVLELKCNVENKFVFTNFDTQLFCFSVE